MHLVGFIIRVGKELLLAALLAQKSAVLKSFFGLSYGTVFRLCT